MGTEPESVDAQKGTMKDILARCFKKNEAQVCLTLLNMCALSNFNLITSTAGRPTFKIYIIWCTYMYLLRPTMLPLSMYKLCCTITVVYFRRLKINHESHEFILDPGTIANRYICIYLCTYVFSKTYVNPCNSCVQQDNRSTMTFHR
jgi:hypothetical protein